MAPVTEKPTPVSGHCVGGLQRKEAQGAGCEASTLPENKLMTVQGSQAWLRALDNQTSSTVLRGWMRRNPHGPLLPKQLTPESLLGVREPVPRT